MIKRLLLGVIATVMVASVAPAAEIKLEGKNADGIPVASVRGDFIERDIERFADVTKDLDDAIISFSSNGGNLITGIETGTRIRLRGYRTVVADREECYSACALAWLGGITRYVGRGAQIGFHAAYLREGGRRLETGVGNALVGSYATNLRFRTPAIIFLTSAPPEGFNHLTEALALRVGIAAEFVDSGKLVLIPRTLLTDEKLGTPSVAGPVSDQISAEEQYQRGRRSYPNNAKTIYWYRLAAEQGHAEAQYFLGIMYGDGSGVRQDHAEAVRWYRQAAEQGYANAQNKLAIMYDNGLGVSQNDVLAYMWFSLAAAQGEPNASNNRDSMARIMSPNQIAEAQRLAREWKPSRR